MVIPRDNMFNSKEHKLAEGWGRRGYHRGMMQFDTGLFGIQDACE